MAVTNDILKAIETLRLDRATKSDLKEVKQSQAQTNNSFAQIKTAVEVVKAGQDDLRVK